MNQFQGVNACSQNKPGPELRFSKGLAKQFGREDRGWLPGFTLKALAATGTIRVHGITNYEKGGPSSPNRQAGCASMTCPLQHTHPLCVPEKQNTKGKAQAKQTTTIYMILVQTTSHM